MKIPIYQVDAFTNVVFRGNPAAVCPLDDWLTDKQMQSIASENNLSETAFFVKEDDACYSLRWFTPAVEVNLCGHATLASAFVLFECLGVQQQEICFKTKSGELTVQKEGAYLLMNFPADDMQPVASPPAVLFQALGIRSDIVFRSEDYMIILDDERQVAELDPDFRMLKEVDTRGIIVTAAGNEVDFVSRFFAPQAGIDEDPVTGSAHTSMTPYWAEELGKNELTARQISERSGDLICRHRQNRVELLGQAVLYLQGEIEF